MIYKLSGPSRSCPDNPETFRRESKSVAIYALYPESFYGKNLAIRKVFAFSDSALMMMNIMMIMVIMLMIMMMKINKIQTYTMVLKSNNNQIIIIS